MAAHLKCFKYIDEILELAKSEGKKICQLGACGLRGSAKEYISEKFGGSAAGLSGYLTLLGFEVDVIDIDGRRGVLPIDLGKPIEDDSELIGAYDIILGYALIEHVENQYELFRNIDKLCKVGGTVILNCPVTGSYQGHGTWTYDYMFFANLFKDCNYKVYDIRTMPLKYGKVKTSNLITYVSYGKTEESIFVERENFTFPRFDKIGHAKDKKSYDKYGAERTIVKPTVKPDGTIKGHSLILIDLIKSEKFKKFAEIGVWKSGSTKRILRSVSDLVEEYWAVDPWVVMPDGSKAQRRRTEEHWNDYYKYCCTLMTFFPQLRIMRMTSEEASALIPDGYFDMVYLDAVHTFEEVYQDIGFWLPKVRKGGLIGGHDYGGKWVGVKEAVDRWFGEENIKYWEIDEVWIKRV